MSKFITVLLTTGLFVSGLAFASNQEFAPEEETIYTVSAPAEKDVLRFAPEEDITYSVSTDNVYGINCDTSID